MAGEEKSNTQLDLDSLSKTDQLSEEDKNELIKSLKRELEEELIVTSSLTHVVAEKTAEIEHLQTKVSEQETRIFNLEDQVEEWTTQADSCDKLLEQKDCEIELLQKTLKIEKQQRRDLEDATMEVCVKLFGLYEQGCQMHSPTVLQTEVRNAPKYANFFILRKSQKYAKSCEKEPKIRQNFEE